MFSSGLTLNCTPVTSSAGGCTIWVRTFGYNLIHGTERFLCCTKFTPLPVGAEVSPGDAAHSGQKAKQILSESAPVFPLIVLAGWRACFQK